MKQSEIKRNVEAIRAWKNKPRKPLERTRISKMSKKKAKYDRAVKPLRNTWLENYDRCWWCRRKAVLHVHHISKKSACGDYDHPCNWFAACDPCNGGPLDKSDKATMAKALALKCINDIENYDLDLWREIHGPSMYRPALSNVLDAIEQLEDARANSFVVDRFIS